MSQHLVTYRQDLTEPTQESGYIHPHLMVTQDGPVLQLDIDHLKQPVYLDAQNLSLLISLLAEREDQLETIERRRTSGPAREPNFGY